jgi:hypothetical protein
MRLAAWVDDPRRAYLWLRGWRRLQAHPGLPERWTRDGRTRFTLAGAVRRQEREDAARANGT